MKKFYGLALLVIMLPAILLVNYYAWYGLQSLSSDLTRIGGFQTEEFGWFGTEYRFAEPLAEHVDEGGTYEKYSDIVVFGDSFSRKPDSNWVYHFVNLTGMSAQIMHYYFGGIEHLVDTDLFHTRPPRVVVFEIVERALKNTFSDAPVTCKVSDALVPLPSDFGPLNIPLIEYERDMSRHYGDYKLAAKVLHNKLSFLTGNSAELKTSIAPLMVDTLFSNKKSDQLLYYRDEYRKGKWPENVSRKTRCGLDSIRERVEANGYTAFAVLLVPDKISVYSPWLIDDKLVNLTLLDDKALTGIPHSLDTLARQIQAVEQGFVDFFLPGDTHWSSKGDLKVAEWMVELFQKNAEFSSLRL